MSHGNHVHIDGALTVSGGPTPSTQQYSPTTHQPHHTQAGTVGQLPFTGADIGILGFATVALFAAAAVLRRLSRPRKETL